MDGLCFYPLAGIGEVREGDSIPRLIIEAIERKGISPQGTDLLVIAHKILSKAQGRQVLLSDVAVSERALELAKITGKPPGVVQLALDESQEIVVARRGALICRSRLGWVSANAGVDLSNTASEEHAVLLPLDPDEDARGISCELEKHFGCKIAVIISDTHGRPLREGIVGVAIGCWGINPMRSYIGNPDRSGSLMQSSVEAVADELASAASLVTGQGAEGIPAVLIRGCKFPWEECGSGALMRKKERELFWPKNGENE